jgi:hypothetical protein
MPSPIGGALFNSVAEAAPFLQAASASGLSHSSIIVPPQTLLTSPTGTSPPSASKTSRMVRKHTAEKLATLVLLARTQGSIMPANSSSGVLLYVDWPTWKRRISG